MVRKERCCGQSKRVSENIFFMIKNKFFYYVLLLLIKDIYTNNNPLVYMLPSKRLFTEYKTRILISKLWDY